MNRWPDSKRASALAPLSNDLPVQEPLAPFVVRKNSSRAGADIVDYLQCPTLPFVVGNEAFAGGKIRRRPEVQVARVAFMAEAFLSDRPLIDSTGVAHQEHPPVWKRVEQRPKFPAR